MPLLISVKWVLKGGLSQAFGGRRRSVGVGTEIWNHFKFLFWIVTICKLGLTPVRDMPSLLKWGIPQQERKWPSMTEKEESPLLWFKKAFNPAKYRFFPHDYGSRSHWSKQTSVVLRIKSSAVSSLNLSIILSVYHTHTHIPTRMRSVPRISKYIRVCSFVVLNMYIV